MNKEIKLCKDCKHHEDGKCHSPKIKWITNIVTGEKKQRWEYCSTQRLFGGILQYFDIKSCGKRGKFFEQK